jgi:hypothetical protein
VLFDGTDLSKWVSTHDGTPARWSVQDGVMTVAKGSGNIETRRRFGNYQLHLEWRIPQHIAGDGQARGNSGVFLASTGDGDLGYELQILDSYRHRTYANGQAGSIYKQYAPLANSARRPGEWQSYNIVWQTPTFGSGALVTRPATVTVIMNGVLVQDHRVLKGPPSMSANRVTPHMAARLSSSKIMATRARGSIFTTSGYGNSTAKLTLAVRQVHRIARILRANSAFTSGLARVSFTSCTSFAERASNAAISEPSCSG